MEAESLLSPGGPGGVLATTPGGTAVPYVGKDGRVKVSLSPPRVVPPLLPGGWPTPTPTPHYDSYAGTPGRGSPQSFNFKGKMLEDRVDEASNSLRKSVHQLGNSASRSGSPLKELEDGDVRAEGQRIELVEEQAEMLARESEEVCKSELETHFKLLRLRNAAAMVPDLLRKSRHLQEELIRARSANPDEIRHALEEIDTKVERLHSETAERSAEEKRQKERLREALAALKEGGFGEDEMVTFMTAALDSALGVVFRVEDERAYLAADVSTQAEEIQRLHDLCAVATQKINDLQAQLINATSGKTTVEMELQEYTARCHDLDASLEASQSELAAERAFSGGLKDKIFELDEEVIRRDKQLADQRREADDEHSRGERQTHLLVEETERVRTRFQKQLEQMEQEMHDARSSMDERLKRERERTAAMEERWKQAEDMRLEDQKKALMKQGDVQVLEEQIAGLVRAAETHAEDIKIERASVASMKADMRQALQTASDAETEQAELRQVTNATVDALDAEKQINSNLRTESQRLTESCVELQDTLRGKANALQEADHTTTQLKQQNTDLTQQLEEVTEAKRLSLEAFSDMTERLQMHAEAAEAAQEARKSLEEEKAKLAEENAAQLEKEAETEKVLSEARDEVVRLGERVEDLEGAEEMLQEAMKQMAEANEIRQAAEAGSAQNKRNAEELAKISSDFERGLTHQTQEQLKDKDEQLEKTRILLKEERQRNERAEDRVRQCVEHLKHLEEQRVKEVSEKRAITTHQGHKIKELEHKLNDAKLDSRCVKKNAKSVGWILAGRGALLRDLYKLHNILAGIPVRHPSTPLGTARELSTHILSTHLFECERRHLGMGPTDQTPQLAIRSPSSMDHLPDSPKAPSPRESARLMMHSPAVQYQERPPSLDYPQPHHISSPLAFTPGTPPQSYSAPLAYPPAGLLSEQKVVSSSTQAALERYREERRARKSSTSSAAPSVPPSARLPGKTHIAAGISGTPGQVPVSNEPPTPSQPLPVRHSLREGSPTPAVSSSQVESSVEKKDVDVDVKEGDEVVDVLEKSVAKSEAKSVGVEREEEEEKVEEVVKEEEADVDKCPPSGQQEPETPPVIEPEAEAEAEAVEEDKSGSVLMYTDTVSTTNE